LTVTLRRTEKLSSVLPATIATPQEPDTALGDWYANRIVVDRKPLLLLLSSRAFLAILLPARELRTLPSRLGEVVAQRLRRFGIAQRVINAEVAAMDRVLVSKTGNRAVVGIMVDFANMIPYHLDRGAWDESTLPFIEAKLAGAPCFSSRSGEQTVFPDLATRAVLAERWGAG
jgi:hypothetical protein